MRAVWALLVGAAIGWFGSTGCSSGPAPCQSSCSGCCDLTNTCQPGTADTACGDNALQCQRCTPGHCVDHACVGGPDGGLGGGAGTGEKDRRREHEQCASNPMTEDLGHSSPSL